MSWLGCLQFAVVSFVSLYRSYGVSERASQQQLSLVNAMSLCENDAGVAGSVDVTEDARAFIQNVCRDGAEGGGVKILLVLDIGSSSIRCSPFVILRAGNSFENVVPLMECNSKLLFAIVSDDINDRSRKKNPGNVNTDMDQLDSIFNNVNAIVNESVSKLKFFFGQFRVTKWKIIGIGFSSLAMSLVATQCNERSNNRHVNQVSPLFVYSCSETSSTSIRQAVKELKSMTDKADHQRTGTILWHPSYAPAQLRAFHQQAGRGRNDNAYGKLTWQTISQYIIFRWTSGGSTNSRPVPMCVCEASWTGLLSVRTMTWDTKAVDCAKLDHDMELPALCQFDEFEGRVSNLDIDIDDQNKLLTRELLDAKIFLGLGDGACSCFGSGCDISPGARISVTIGTSAAVRVLVDLSHQSNSHTIDADAVFPVLPDGLFCYRVTKRFLMIGGALSDGGNLIEWFNKVLALYGDHTNSNSVKRVSIARLLNRLQLQYSKLTLLRKARDGRLPFVLPFWSGERAPGWNSKASGSMHGITRATRADDILFALMEGVCMRLSTIVLLIQQAGLLRTCASAHDCFQQPVKLSLIASGAGLETNSLWCQMLADVTGIEVIRPVTPRLCELTSFGLAKLMARSLGESDCDLGSVGGNVKHDFEFTKRNGIFSPNSELAPFYVSRKNNISDCILRNSVSCVQRVVIPNRNVSAHNYSCAAY
jgi:sugar (pentulose or hexulose) kinase